MMMNLFSIFDPSTNMNLSLNWSSTLYIMMFLPNMYWLIPSKYHNMWRIILMYLFNEMKNPLNTMKNFMNTLLLNSLFVMIMMNNFITLFPYMFNTTSHLSMSMTLSMTLWLSFMMYSWIMHSYNMWVHLTPQSTPYLLMPFMVIIETMSIIIRPLTLSIRLSANIIAGHLILTLISQTMPHMMLPLNISMIILQSVLTILEMAVTFIQAYIFMTLSSLYLKETN